MFLHLSVNPSVHSGVCPSPCWDTPPPHRKADPPSQQTATAADGMHPSVIQSCCQLCVYVNKSIVIKPFTVQ